MTVLNRFDIMGEQVFDYDVVWKATRDSLVLAVVKNVRTPFKRVNPQYSYRNPTNVPRHITGIEDKVLYVLNYGKVDLHKPPTSSGTCREHGMNGVLKVTDQYILNSQLVAELRDRAKKMKK